MLTIAASDVSKLEGNSGSTTFTFTVARTGYLSQVSRVDWAVSGGGNGGSPADAADLAAGLLPSGTLTFASGETSKTISIDIVGDNVVEPDENFTVTLSNPSSSTSIATVSAISTISNDDASLSIAANSLSSAYEGNAGTTPLTFTVSRTGYLSQTSRATWSVTGSGTNPANSTDFIGNVMPTGTVDFASGESTKTITVNVAGDTQIEADETFTISLATPTLGTAIKTASATGSILNEDGIARLDLSPSSISQPEGGTSGFIYYSYTVTRSVNLGVASAVAWAVTGSGANPAIADDFIGFSAGVLPFGTVSFAPGETSKTINVGVRGDNVVEPDENFTVALSNPSSGSSLGTSSATGTIVNDDTAITIVATDAFKLEGNLEGSRGSNTPFTFTVNRAGVINTTGTVRWAVAGTGTNRADSADFWGEVMQNGTLSFAAGESSKVITVNVAGDNTFEQDETFTVTLSNPANASSTSITQDTAQGTILNDEASVGVQSTSPMSINTGVSPVQKVTTSVSAGLNSPSLTFIGPPDAVTYPSGAATTHYRLQPSSGIETITNFQYARDQLDIDLLGAATSMLQVADTSVNGAHAISIYSGADPTRGVVLLGMGSSQTAADLMANHLTFSNGHALVG